MEICTQFSKQNRFFLMLQLRFLLSVLEIVDILYTSFFFNLFKINFFEGKKLEIVITCSS